jgi:hypothetical protein
MLVVPTYVCLTEMGTFDETAIVGYHLSFADKGKQTPVFCFCLKQTNGSSPFPFPFAENKQKLPFSISPVFRLRKHREMETWRNGNMETWRHGDHGHGDIKWIMEPRRFSLIHSTFAHHANGS